MIFKISIERNATEHYLKTSTYNISSSLKEIEQLINGNDNLWNSLSLEEIKEWSCKIENENLSSWETIILLNLSSLMSKMSIIKWKLTLIRHSSLFIFLDFSSPKISKLHLEEVNFELLNMDENINSYEDWRYKLILKEKNWNLNSYCLFCILKNWKLLSSLDEICIKQSDISFAVDLYKLIEKYSSSHKLYLKTKIIYIDPENHSEIEINNYYFDQNLVSMISNKQNYFSSKFIEKVI